MVTTILILYSGKPTADLHYNPEVCQLGKGCWRPASVYALFIAGLHVKCCTLCQERTQRTLRKARQQNKTHKKPVRKPCRSSIEM